MSNEILVAGVRRSSSALGVCVFVCLSVVLCRACCVVRLVLSVMCVSVFSVLWMSVFSVLCVSVSDVTDERRREREEEGKTRRTKGTGTRWC